MRERHFAAGACEARLVDHRHDRVRRDRDRASARSRRSRASSTTPRRRNAQQSYATDTKKLAGSRLSAPTLQPMSDTAPPKPIVPTPSVLTVPMMVGFELRQPRIGIDVVERPEQLFLRVQVAGRAIAADAHADRAGLQPLPCACHTAWRMHLRTPSSVRSARPRFGSSIGSEILGVHVLAAAALQEQLDLDLVASPTARSG